MKIEVLRDGFMIRIAEMYLIAAEAGAKANKADALDYMNKIAYDSCHIRI